MDPWRNVGFTFEIDDVAEDVSREVARLLETSSLGAPKHPQISEAGLEMFGTGGWADVPVQREDRRDLMVCIGREIGFARAPIAWASRVAATVASSCRPSELGVTAGAAVLSAGLGFRVKDGLIAGVPVDRGMSAVILVDGETAGVWHIDQALDEGEPMDPSVTTMSFPDEPSDVWPMEREVLRWIEELVPVMVAADALGAAERAWTLAKAHVETREQFGRTLSQNQIVRTQLASAAVELIRCRGALAHWCQGNGADAAHPDGRSLFRMITEAARRHTRATVHLHGAMGYTAEHPVGWCLMRVVADESLLTRSQRELLNVGSI